MRARREEHNLALRFGEAYEEYWRRVPFMLPLRPPLDAEAIATRSPPWASRRRPHPRSSRPPTLRREGVTGITILASAGNRMRDGDTIRWLCLAQST